MRCQLAADTELPFPSFSGNRPLRFVGTGYTNFGRSLFEKGMSPACANVAYFIQVAE